MRIQESSLSSSPPDSGNSTLHLRSSLHEPFRMQVTLARVKGLWKVDHLHVFVPSYIAWNVGMFFNHFII